MFDCGSQNEPATQPVTDVQAEPFRAGSIFGGVSPTHLPMPQISLVCWQVPETHSASIAHIAFAARVPRVNALHSVGSTRPASSVRSHVAFAIASKHDCTLLPL